MTTKQYQQTTMNNQPDDADNVPSKHHQYQAIYSAQKGAAEESIWAQFSRVIIGVNRLTSRGRRVCVLSSDVRTPGLSVISYVTGCHCSDMSSPHHHTVRIRMVSSVKCSITCNLLPLHVLYRHEHETRGIIPLPCALASCIVWCLMPLIFIWIEAQKMPMNVDVCRVSQKNAWSCFLAITPLWKGLEIKVGWFKFRKFSMW